MFKLNQMLEIIKTKNIILEYSDLVESVNGHVYMFEDLKIMLINNRVLEDKRVHKAVLAEELGHYFTTTKNSIPYKYNSYRDKLSIDKEEQRALRWAANFLMPTDELLEDIKTRHMQEIIKTCGKGYSTLRKIKVLFNQLFKYAMENDVVTKDYSDYVDIGKNSEKSSRKPFTASEIDRLWSVVDDMPLVDSILIMIYTGLRIGELLIIKCSDVDLDNRIIIGGIKTDAGKDRVIPISSKIYPHVDKFLSSEHEYLISKKDGTAYNYSNYYRENFVNIMKKLNMDHKPHDCRHTFATLMTNAKADTISLQKIIGHANYETTANIYTHKDIDELKKAIDLI